MKRTVAVVIVSLCCWLVSSVGSAQRCTDSDVPMTIEIHVGRDGGTGPIVYRYPNKENESAPTICRNRDFKLSVNFLDDSVKQLKLKNFMATFTGGNKCKKVVPSSFTLQITVTPDPNGAFPQPIETPTYRLGTTWSPPGLVKVRMILFTVEMTLADGTVVSFDPPWGERP